MTVYNVDEWDDVNFELRRIKYAMSDCEFLIEEEYESFQAYAGLPPQLGYVQELEEKEAIDSS